MITFQDWIYYLKINNKTIGQSHVIPPISTRQIPNHKKTKTYDVGNLRPGLRQAHKCGRVKPVIVMV
jgi:hypothetical protein